MNERIRELAGKALDRAVPETWTTLTPEQLEKVQEKFAELIVRECADIADFCDQAESVEAVSSVLKRHFGVE